MNKVNEVINPYSLMTTNELQVALLNYESELKTCPEELIVGISQLCHIIVTELNSRTI